MAKITFVARMTCKPEKRAEFIRLCRQLEEHVRANEPETVLYESVSYTHLTLPTKRIV